MVIMIIISIIILITRETRRVKKEKVLRSYNMNKYVQRGIDYATLNNNLMKLCNKIYDMNVNITQSHYR
jgi:hypothetical protein